MHGAGEGGCRRIMMVMSEFRVNKKLMRQNADGSVSHVMVPVLKEAELLGRLSQWKPRACTVTL